MKEKFGTFKNRSHLTYKRRNLRKHNAAEISDSTDVDTSDDQLFTHTPFTATLLAQNQGPMDSGGPRERGDQRGIGNLSTGEQRNPAREKRTYHSQVIIFTMRVTVPLSILIVGVFSSIRAEVPKTCEEEYLSDIQQKVKDLWLTMLHANPFQANTDGVSYATCVLKPSTKLQDSDLKVTGVVMFKQTFPIGNLEASFTVEGFPMDNNQTVRAIHIHNFGDLSDGCDSAGGHYNPVSVKHPGHPGDFGNFRVIDGKIEKNVAYTEATLFGPYSILGRSVVVHMQADDLGKGNNQASLENGNAGKRLACCVIGFSNQSNWERHMEAMPGLKTPRLYRRANKKKTVKG